MNLAKVRRIGLFFGAAALLAAPLLLAGDGPHRVEGGLDRAVPDGVLIGFDDSDCGVKAVEIPGYVSVCLHPDTDREEAVEILRNLPTYLGIDIPGGPGKETYNLSTRWSNTAIDGGTGSAGDPINLTWGFVPDGTWADGGTSNLISVFDAQWGSSGWMNKIRNAFVLWDREMGISYTEVSDDGASLPNNPGVFGTRPDCRISGRSIDGPSNVLAYNYYPNGGDMVIDTDDVAYFYNPLNNYGTLKNVVMHEHGHGIGMGHVTPENCTKLMEAYSCGAGSFVGAQDDDVRGAQRFYGDVYENNDVIGDAYDLGTLSDTLFALNGSIDHGIDEDFYSFSGSGVIDIYVDPIGSAYLIGDQYGPSPTYIRTDSISDLDFCLYDGSGTLLDSVYAMNASETEELIGFNLPAAGDYILKVFRKDGTGNAVQRYDLSVIQSDVSTDVLLADGEVPARDLDLRITPNPFNPRTTAKFFASAPGAYTVDVYDVSGRLARRIEGRTSAAGVVEVPWDGRNQNGEGVASGVYLMRLSHGDKTETQRAVLVR